jgi:hypothetical protein
MKNIDFLPEIYRERAASRQAYVWWGVVVGIFSLAISLTLGAQYLLKRSVRHQIEQLAPDYQAAQHKAQHLADLQSQIKSAGHWASLVTYLEHPWPRSQLLAVVVQPLPETVHLTQLILVEEEQARPAANPALGGRRAARDQPQEEDRRSPAQRDLDTLRSAHMYKRPVIEVTGSVTDVSDLHDYVADLARLPLVSKAQIKSLESAATNRSQPTQFTLRLVFASGHAQPEFADPGNVVADRDRPPLRIADRDRSAPQVAQREELP